MTTGEDCGLSRPWDPRFDQPDIPSSDDFSSDPAVWDMVIVGSGVAGSALAYRQAMEGRRVLVLEKSLSQPDRIVGELLQPGGFLKLRDLGLADCVENIDSCKVYGYALFKGGHVSCVKYPTEHYAFEVAGRSFHHGRFVQKLRAKAASSPLVTMRQAVVRKLLDVDGREWDEASGRPVGGVAYRHHSGEDREARAKLTVVCDGMVSTFRRKFTNPSISSLSFFVGLLLDGAQLPFPNHGHVVLGEPSPTLFYPISSNQVRCLADVPGSKLPSVTDGAMAEYLMKHVFPQVPDILKEPFKQAVAKGHFKAMQNKALSAQPVQVAGALLLGDAYNMRHPLTGGGMTVALSDTKLLCDMLHGLTAASLGDLDAVSRCTRSFYQTRKPLAGTINTLANALYRVFCWSPWEPHEEMRQACFDYLSLGGVYSSGPVSLLSGLNPRPSVLVMHFFMVALFGCGRLLLPRPTLRGVWMAVLLLYCACRIILPIIASEGVLAVFLPGLMAPPSTDSSLADKLPHAGATTKKHD